MAGWLAGGPIEKSPHDHIICSFVNIHAYRGYMCMACHFIVDDDDDTIIDDIKEKVKLAESDIFRWTPFRSEVFSAIELANYNRSSCRMHIIFIIVSP